jgi:hypothetical protein
MNTLDSVSGYYKLGDTVIYNKLQALTDPTLNGRHLEYVFHDDVYSQLNWAVEPTETLEQLYVRRAWEIREKYDYLVIHFSGGSDSTNILEIFLKNNIPFEELYSRGRLADIDPDPSNTSPDNAPAEVPLNAVPIVDYVNRINPNIKIKHTIGDYKDYVQTYFTNNPDWFDVTKHDIITTFAPTDVNRADHDAITKQYNKIAETGKSIGHILGVEKPMMYFDNGNYFARFLDKQVKFQLSSRRTSIDTPINLVPFYWARSTGPMIIKQCHVIKNYLKYKNINPDILSSNSRNTQDIIAQIIYNRTLPLFFQAEKDPGRGMQGNGFFTKDTEAVYYKNWMNGILELDRMIPASYKSGSILNDLHGIWSKSYCIGN